jgi:Zn-dependent peptidase ImmA (M78 family)
MRDIAPRASRHFSVINPYEFSAVTVFSGTRRIVVYNDSHSKGRQSSDITHEVSHGLLLHSPKPALDANGCRNWDEDCEDEANWLGGVLLVPDEAALNIARLDMVVEEAADFYRVSKQMIEWRLRMTAARKRLQRLRGFYASRRAS